VLAATAVPTLLVTAGQLTLVAVGVAVLGLFPVPVDVVLPAVAVVLGAALMVVLAAASSVFTRTPESAQITTLPVVVGATTLSGLFFPVSMLPEALAMVARLLPLTPVGRHGSQPLCHRGEEPAGGRAGAARPRSSPTSAGSPRSRCARCATSSAATGAATYPASSPAPGRCCVRLG
jgi:hypothetical protein